MLANTLTELFTHASKPESIIAGVVQQNCVVKCKTGVQVVSKPGEPVRTKVSDAPADADGVADFCASAVGQPHCRAGRVRVARERDGESGRPSRGISPPSYGWASSSTSRSTRTCGRGRRGTTSCGGRCGDVLSSVGDVRVPAGTLERLAKHGAVRGKLCSGTFSTSPVEAHIFRLGGGGGGRTSPRLRQSRLEAYSSARASSRHILVSCKWRPSTRSYLLYLWAKKSCLPRGSIRTASTSTRLESTSSRTSIDLVDLRFTKILGVAGSGFWVWWLQYQIHADDRG